MNSEVEAIKRKNKKLEEGIMKAQKDVEGKQEEMRGLVAEITAVQGKVAWGVRARWWRYVFRMLL